MSQVTGPITDILSQLNPRSFNNNPVLDRYFANWQYDRLQETDNLYKSGIITQAGPYEQQLLNSGNGMSVAIPHVTAIDTSLMPQRLSSDTDIHGNTDGKTYTEYEIKALEAQSYNFSEVDKYKTGVDQQNNVLNQMTDYWAHIDEARLMHVIESAFKNPAIAAAKGYHLNQGEAKQLTPGDFMAANARMGDNNMSSLTRIVVNSAVYWYMRAQNTFNNYIQLPSQSGNAFSTYQGFQIICDDQIPVQPDGTTTMYIFGPGAVQYVTEPFPGDGVSLTQDHNHDGGVVQFTQKRVVCAHVVGTAVDPAAAQNAGYGDDFEDHWDQILWGDNPVYRPKNEETLRDMKLVKYNFTIPKEFRTVGVNTPDASGNLGDDGYDQHKSNGSGNSDPASNNAPKSPTTKSK